MIGGFRELLECVVPDRFEHHQACAPVGLVPSIDHALGDKRLECLEVGAGHRLGGIERRTPREHRTTGECPLQRLIEHPVAPLERRDQRALPRGGVPRPAAEIGYGIVQTCGELRGAQHGGARRGELECQGQTIEPRTDLGDSRRRPRGCLEAVVAAAGCQQEQGPGSGRFDLARC